MKTKAGFKGKKRGLIKTEGKDLSRQKKADLPIISDGPSAECLRPREDREPIKMKEDAGTRPSVMSLRRSAEKLLNKKRSATDFASNGTVSADLNTLVQELQVHQIELEMHNEELKRTSEERYRSLVETTADWIWEVNAEGVYTYASPKVKDLLGYEPFEVVGRTPFDFMPAEEARRLAPLVQRHFKNGEPLVVLENMNLHKDGRSVLLETKGVPFFDEKGALLGYRGVDRDVTELKRAQIELQAAHDELESRVQERTALLEQAHREMFLFSEQLREEVRHRQEAEKDLEERLQFEALVAELSVRFINLPADQVDDAIVDTQRRVCEYLGLDLAALWQWSTETPRIVKMTHIYYPPGSPLLPQPTFGHEQFPWYQQQMEAGRIIAISSIEELPAEAARDKEVARYLGIKSNLSLPLSSGGGPIIGILGFNTVFRERTWPEPVIARLQIIAQIFTHVLIRKQAEMALRESEARLSLATESVGAGLWIMDVSTGKVWVSPRTRELFHFAPDEELCYERFFKVIHPVDREQVYQDVERSIHSDEHLQCDYRIVIPDGSIRWIVSRGKHHVDSMGEPNRIMGLSLDITERKLMEEKIEASAKEWQVTFDSIPDLIMILDRERRVVRVNAAARHFLGLPPEHVVGNSCSGLVHGIKEPVEGCPFEKVMSSGKHEEIEIYDEARQLWFRVYMYPILNERGDVIQIIHRAEDITQQKKEENERFVARRALMRTERLLRMGELTASLAHELNQPLTSILSNTRAALRFIQSGKLDMGELSDILQDIAEDDKRAGSIIRSLRSMLRPQESEREIIAINDVLQEIVSVYFHSESIIRRISVETDFARSLPLVNIDKVQVQQVIINLMMNAADAMMDNVGEKRIIIRTQMSGDGGILVSIRDFGPGIDEVELAKIFEPFFTTKRSGLGMGLSLSHSIIEGQGGHIWAENNPDRGSTFYFDLPGKEKGIG